MDKIDLHVHTSESDGTTSPEETVRLAKEKNLRAIAITDHDTAAGVAAAMAEGERCGVEVIPGIEISVDYMGLEGVHILGYFINPASPAMMELLDWVVAERKRRNRAIAAAMQSDGIPISVEELARRYPESVIGRPHIAAWLTEHGYTSSVRDAFDRYLSTKYFIRREYIPIPEAFRVIKSAGGKAVFAHPFQYGLPEEELIALTAMLREQGAVGIECYYSGYTPRETEYLKSLADKFGMCATGGSDFHGGRKPPISLGSGMGDLSIPYEVLENLKNA